MNKRALMAAGVFASLMILIIDSSTAQQGVSDGITLCLKSVVPSLFPFLFISSFAQGILGGKPLWIERLVERICRMPTRSGMVYVLGLLGGYPTGAATISLAYSQGLMGQADAKRLLGFCSNAGPAFIFGMAGSLFDRKWIPWVLWGIHILSSLLTGMMLPGSPSAAYQIRFGKGVSFREAMERSIRSMASICGCVVLFRVIREFINSWLPLSIPTFLRIGITGMLELTGGICDLPTLTNTGEKMILFSAILAFGGLCVTLQTVSVTQKLGLGSYLPGKILQMFLSTVLTWVLQFTLLPASEKLRNPLPMLALVPVFGFLLIKSLKNNSSNFSVVRV